MAISSMRSPCFYSPFGIRFARNDNCKRVKEIYMKRHYLSLAIFFMCFGRMSNAALLEDLEEAFASVAEKVGPAVVSISTLQTYRVEGGYLAEPFGSDKTLSEFFRRYFVLPPETELQKYSLGSGIIVKPEGYILTNYHVIQEADEVQVTLHDGRKFTAQVKGRDVRSDLAILKIDAQDLPVARLGESAKVRTGQWVIAIGNPFGYLLKDQQATVTVGVVSATHRKLPDAGLGQGPYYFDLIQTDAAINPGNSGGPLVNLKGEVIGINMAIFSTTGGYQGLGFAVPVDVAKNVLEDLVQGGSIQYGWLGLGVGSIDSRIAKDLNLPDQKGALVLKIFEGSSAEKYQLKELDVIRKMGDIPIQTPEDLIQAVAKLRAGTSISIELVRKGEPLRIEVVLDAHPSGVYNK